MKRTGSTLIFMKIILSFAVLVLLAYLFLVAVMFLFQRNLLYYPVPYQAGIDREEISFTNDGLELHGWILNPGKARALMYFGGNAESIENNIGNFEVTFRNHSVYLIHYRGYGKSEGKPTEPGLLSDALAIYDAIQPQHETISIMGRSLGSGVAVYLASKRAIEKLVLITSYDSIVEVAHSHYPFLPVRYLARDRFEAFRYAGDITAPVLMITAELDRIVPKERALALREYLTNTQVDYHVIASADHNDLAEFVEYQRILDGFVNG